MAQDVQKIHVGAARIFLDGVAPATGAPPSLTVHTSGVPSSPQTGFVEAGHTFEDTVLEYTAEYQDIMSEQVFGIADTFVSMQSATLRFTAQERVYNTLRLIFDGIGTVTDGSKDLFYFGGVFTVLSHCFVFTSPLRTNPAKFEVGTLYKCQISTPANLTYSRVNPSRIPVTVRGIHDASRTVGDQLGQWFREK